MAILIVQTGFSLSLVWSNGAFGDEANYLWQGHLEWAHWLHGYAIPVFHDSGTPEIYPPLGALAESIGGLAGARILSLCFMLAATTLLYLTASRIFGVRAAIIGSALWALSEPVLRLAFATYDPMACLLVTLSAWLALQAGLRSRRYVWTAASAVTLALGCVTTFAFTSSVPIVLAFAYFVWSENMGRRKACWNAALFLAGVLVLTAVAATVLHLWSLFFSFASYVSSNTGRAAGGAGGTGVSAVARSAWSWDGLTFVLACIGVIAALVCERRQSRKLLLLTLVGAGLVVPIYQAHIGSGWALDKDMSAGTWFLAMAAGYGVARLTATVHWKPLTAALVAVAFLAFPAISGLSYARTVFHLWPNTSALAARVEPLLRATTRPILAAGAPSNLENALPQGYDWRRWSAGVPPTVGLRSGLYGVVVLQLDSTINSAQLLRDVVSRQVGGLSADVLALSTANAIESNGLLILLRDTVRNKYYSLQYVIPFTTSNPNARSGLFAVWKRIGLGHENNASLPG